MSRVYEYYREDELISVEEQQEWLEWYNNNKQQENGN